MGKEAYYYSENMNYVYSPQDLKKAAGADTYLLKGMGSAAYPNLCVTSDFRRFSPVSALEPETKYNWLTDTLVHWRTFAGKEGEGILYRPENFDPGKKYPVIFYFYERLSAQLNHYLVPEFSNGAINIGIGRWGIRAPVSLTMCCQRQNIWRKRNGWIPQGWGSMAIVGADLKSITS